MPKPGRAQPARRQRHRQEDARQEEQGQRQAVGDRGHRVLESRVEQVEASARATGFAIDDIPGSPTMPATVTEHYRLAQARLDGEGAWARQLIERLRAGDYWFDGEPDPPWSTQPSGGAQAMHGADS